MANFYKKTEITITNLSRVPLPYHVPVDDRPEGFEMGGAAVLVVQVVGVLPYVEGENGFEAMGYRIVCIGALEDGQFAILVGGEPHPAAAEEAHALGFKIGLEGFEGAPLLLDLGKEIAGRGRQRRLQSELRKVQVVVQDLACVVENGRRFLDSAQNDNFLQGLAFKVSAGDKFVEVVDVGLQVLAVVE